MKKPFFLGLILVVLGSVYLYTMGHSPKVAFSISLLLVVFVALGIFIVRDGLKQPRAKAVQAENEAFE